MNRAICTSLESLVQFLLQFCLTQAGERLRLTARRLAVATRLQISSPHAATRSEPWPGGLIGRQQMQKGTSRRREKEDN